MVETVYFEIVNGNYLAFSPYTVINIKNEKTSRIIVCQVSNIQVRKALALSKSINSRSYQHLLSAKWPSFAAVASFYGCCYGAKDHLAQSDCSKDQFSTDTEIPRVDPSVTHSEVESQSNLG